MCTRGNELVEAQAIFTLVQGVHWSRAREVYARSCVAAHPKALGELSMVPTAIRRARRTACGYCGRLGASIGCNMKRCESSYHFACALQVGVVYQKDKASSTWCPIHTPTCSAHAKW